MNVIYTKLKIVFVAAILFSLTIAQANATQIYFNDFQNGSVGSEWSSSRIDSAPNPDLAAWGSFLGQFGGNDVAALTLTGIPVGLVTLSFDTYFIRSWDGNATTYGPDYFKVAVAGGPTLLNDTFSNGNPAGQSYVGNGISATAFLNSTNTSMTGSALQYSLGYYFYDGIRNTNEAMDSIYHFDFSFLNSADSIQLLFAGTGLQDNIVTGLNGETYLDESWGLDNVRVDAAPVPEPSSLLLLAGGAFGLLALRARRKNI